MAPRLSKRQQRELQELEELGGAAAARPGSAYSAAPAAARLADESESEGEQTTAPQQQRPGFTSAFAGLDDDAEDEQEDDDDMTAAPPVQEQQQQQRTASAKKSTAQKKKKGAKGKGGKGKDAQSGTSSPAPSSRGTPTKKDDDDQGLDEIDRAMRELQAAGKISADDAKAAERAAAAQAEGDRRRRDLAAHWHELKTLLSVDQRHLDPEVELRRFFGRKVLEADTAAMGGNAARGGGGARSMHHPRLANNPHHSTNVKRTATLLAQPEQGWFPLGYGGGAIELTRDGDGTARDDDADVDELGDLYTFVHTRRYKETQYMFLEVLQQADGNRLFDVLKLNPYHVDTLLQLSEMSAQQGDLGAASDFLSRALYAMSATLPPSFTGGTFRLAYDKVENRAFFLAVARKVAIFVKRGTWRTGFEWAKIALATGGPQDPMGMLLFLDFLAPKARQNEWFLRLVDVLPRCYPHLRTECFPGLAYAKALCLRDMEDETKSKDHTGSTRALKAAILRFPLVVPLLCTAIGGNEPPKMVSHRRAQPTGTFQTTSAWAISMLASIYVERSSALWKPPQMVAWLQATARDAADALDDPTDPDVRAGEQIWDRGFEPVAGKRSGGGGVDVPRGVVRAAYLSEIASVKPYLPREVVSGTQWSYDPVPPTGSASVTTYDDEYFSALIRGGGGGSGGRSSMPGRGGGGAAAAGEGEGEPGSVRWLYNTVRRMFGAGELPPELAHDLRDLLQLQQAGGGIPGGWDGDDDIAQYLPAQAGESEDETTDDEEDGLPEEQQHI